jgi:hypothetical protein
MLILQLVPRDNSFPAAKKKPRKLADLLVIVSAFVASYV